jgi:putative endonuclease
MTTSPFSKMQGNRQVGMYGENIATNFLLKEGAIVEDRNFRTRFGEIDIVSRKDGIFTFSEVKTRRSGSHGAPEDAIDETKWQRMQEIAEIWLSRRKIDPSVPYRLDIFSVQLIKDGSTELRRIGDYGI